MVFYRSRSQQLTKVLTNLLAKGWERHYDEDVNVYATLINSNDIMPKPNLFI